MPCVTPDPLHAFRQYLERCGPLPDESFTNLLTEVRTEHYDKNAYLLPSPQY